LWLVTGESQTAKHHCACTPRRVIRFVGYSVFWLIGNPTNHDGENCPRVVRLSVYARFFRCTSTLLGTIKSRPKGRSYKILRVRARATAQDPRRRTQDFARYSVFKDAACTLRLTTGAQGHRERRNSFSTYREMTVCFSVIRS